MFSKKNKTIYLSNNREWKEKNKEYLMHVQSFLDKVDNIENEGLKRDIITQMLKCDSILTKLAEEEFIKQYKKGQANEFYPSL